ncbi:Cell surface protein [Labilithrix luteola]|uniref:Cell surface protein n=1 Tax=Labilithrix luteola TaxID=1391654 RepID=A0A0K1QGF6_9BACT|nr:hypothetical protein [Labilithrix luteola]AKV04803.1 Cell surface protein [Labilithrix luteola]
MPRTLGPLGAALVATLAGCTAILGFDKDVVEQGRIVNGANDSGPAPTSPSDEPDASEPPPEAALRGVPDTTFGDGGAASIVSGLDVSADQPEAVRVQCGALFDETDDLLVACATDNSRAAVKRRTHALRFTTAGVVDSTFGSADGGGAEFTDFVSQPARRPQGGYLFVGYADDPGSSNYRMGRNLVAALTADGAPDPSFADAGRLTVAVTKPDEGDTLESVVAIGDKVLVSGRTWAKNSDSFFLGHSFWGEVDPTTGQYSKLVDKRAEALNSEWTTGAFRPSAGTTLVIGTMIRSGYTADTVTISRYAGEDLDPTYGDGGLAEISQPGLNLMAVVGSLDSTNTGAALVAASGALDAGSVVRFTSDGKRDPAFGDGGVRPLPPPPPLFPGSLQITAMLPVADGKLIVGGNILLPNKTRSPFILRLDAKGAADLEFGTSGWIQPSIGEVSGQASIEALRFSKDGRLLAVGTAVNDVGTRDIFVLRFR